VVEHDDPVGALHGGQPMGDDDRRPAGHRGFQCRLHDALALGVEAAGRFVEQQQRRILEDRTGNGDALALATGEANAALADEGGVAFGQTPNEFIDEGRACGRADLLGRGAGLAVADVVGDAAREDHRLLRHHRDARAQIGQARRRRSMPSIRMAPSPTS
jgi:hypothetical protein